MERGLGSLPKRPRQGEGGLPQEPGRTATANCHGLLLGSLTDRNTETLRREDIPKARRIVEANRAVSGGRRARAPVLENLGLSVTSAQ
ncbi:uncharacterized protein LOC124516116 isoform X2 [Lynx rufus]|uniref:uncharacterized protein LOC124516116 isoform X2 n=1 Tax=Lynx rufus TaxID=61384 RepID=UPI001F125AA5|nr:uncharacterized protein LOC124516116 isoform X2 [Lynx rufus]